MRILTGICSGPIVVAIDGLTLKGVGTPIIDGGDGSTDAAFKCRSLAASCSLATIDHRGKRCK